MRSTFAMLFETNLNKKRVKKQLLSIMAAASSLVSVAQNSVSVDLADGKTNQSYYSFENGEVANIDNSDWDLAFGVQGVSSTVRINSIKGIALWEAPNDYDDWANIDTAGIASWTQLDNSVQDLEVGAFNANADANDPFDLGWASYNISTHQIEANSLYVIKLSADVYKKIKLEGLLGGVYTFTYSDLDGQNSVTSTLDKSDFENKLFGYYSFDDETTLNREPNADEWDIVFTKYGIAIYAGPTYGWHRTSATGVLSNPSSHVSEIHKEGISLADISFADTIDFPLSAEANIIGYDWKKTFDYVNYEVSDTTAFLIETASGDYYKFKFTAFSTSNGEFTFDYDVVEDIAAGIGNSKEELQLYPNPTTGLVQLNSHIQEVQVYDILGNLISNKKINTGRLDITTLPTGMYVIMARINGVQFSSRVTKQ